MPINFFASVFTEGTDVIPFWAQIKTYGPFVLSVALLKYYFAGAFNTWDAKLYSRVYIVTGGTAGLGASVVEELASRGAQLVLLVRNTHDQWLIDYVDSLRERHGNSLIYAEQCDLNSLHSIREFASSWLNSQTPRRLDGIILCAGESLPMGNPRELSKDGIEKQIAINYLANVHLLNLMGPAIRSQPSDRKVTILGTSCLSQVFGSINFDDLFWEKTKYPSNAPWKVFGSSKLMLSCFIKEYQRRLDSYVRSDKTSMSVKVNIVNPGIMRSPSTKQFFSFGTLTGLMFYVLIYPILWVIFKSTYQGAQSFFYALMNPELEFKSGGLFIQECSIVQKPKTELNDEALQKKLFVETEKFIEKLEKNSAIQRNKKKGNKKNKKQKEVKKEVPVPNHSMLGKHENEIQKALSKMDKTLPLFGENSARSLPKENKYLKELDAKFEARKALRTVQNGAKPTSTKSRKT